MGTVEENAQSMIQVILKSSSTKILLVLRSGFQRGNPLSKFLKVVNNCWPIAGIICCRKCPAMQQSNLFLLLSIFEPRVTKSFHRLTADRWERFQVF